MHIESITIIGFRCFGPAPTTVSLSADRTAIVGASASGKTEILQALVRLFGAQTSSIA